MTISTSNYRQTLTNNKKLSLYDINRLALDKKRSKKRTQTTEQCLLFFNNIQVI